MNASTPFPSVTLGTHSALRTFFVMASGVSSRSILLSGKGVSMEFAGASNV